MAEKINIFNELLKYAKTDEARENILKSDGRTLNALYRNLRIISNKELGEFDRESALSAIANIDSTINTGDAKITYNKSTDSYTVANKNKWDKILDSYEENLSNRVPFEKTVDALVDDNRLYDVGRWLQRLDGTVIDGFVYDLPDDLKDPSLQAAIAAYIKYHASPELKELVKDYLSVTKVNFGKYDEESTKARQDAAKGIAMQMIQEFGISHKAYTEAEAFKKAEEYIPMDF